MPANSFALSQTSETGTRLYIVFKALTKFLYIGPVDACRFRAKNVLSEDVLLSEEIEFTAIVSCDLSLSFKVHMQFCI